MVGREGPLWRLGPYISSLEPNSHLPLTAFRRSGWRSSYSSTQSFSPEAWSLCCCPRNSCTYGCVACCASSCSKTMSALTRLPFYLAAAHPEPMGHCREGHRSAGYHRCCPIRNENWSFSPISSSWNFSFFDNIPYRRIKKSVFQLGGLKTKYLRFYSVLPQLDKRIFEKYMNRVKKLASNL